MKDLLCKAYFEASSKSREKPSGQRLYEQLAMRRLSSDLACFVQIMPLCRLQSDLSNPEALRPVLPILEPFFFPGSIDTCSCSGMILMPLLGPTLQTNALQAHSEGPHPRPHGCQYLLAAGVLMFLLNRSTLHRNSLIRHEAAIPSSMTSRVSSSSKPSSGLHRLRILFKIFGLIKGR